jgi:hypothetical protein
MLMPIADQFRQYANETSLWACEAKNDDDGQSLLDLTRTWTQAVLIGCHSQIGNDKTVHAA